MPQAYQVKYWASLPKAPAGAPTHDDAVYEACEVSPLNFGDTMRAIGFSEAPSKRERK